MIFWVTALPAEARPLIGALKLQRQDIGPFPLYHDADRRHHLVVTGLGKTAAACAVGWLAGTINPPTNSVWINFGICGCGSAAADVGSLFAANKITDADTGQNWYPGRVLPFDPSRQVTTVSRPEREFRANTLYDMEASGFYPAACRWSPRDLVHCFKIVSDNEKSGTENVTAKHVEQWISDHARQVIDSALQLREILPARPAHSVETLTEYCLKKWHFSQTRALKLRQLLDLCHVAGQHDLETRLQDCRSARDVLQRLQDLIESTPLKLECRYKP